MTDIDNINIFIACNYKFVKRVLISELKQKILYKIEICLTRLFK